jgi:serine/threonine-protein kinase
MLERRAFGDQSLPDPPNQLRDALADRYRLERELGQGGMATVYVAEDLKHERQVAIKVLRPELAAVLGAERFLAEIKTTANLRHPHILPLYDSGEAAGFLYYVMPLVDGESLRDRLTRQKQLPIDEALGIAREVADALGYSHARGIIHRDIKPENILLEGGHAVLADFGIARAVSAAGAERLTQTGISVGTPLYMSPEQAAGDPDLDGRSDLYSLGCVLYEMLAGEPPHTGPTPQAIIARAMTSPPRPIHPMRPEVSPLLDRVIAKAMAMTPADRYPDAAKFHAGLETGSLSSAPRPQFVRALTQRPLFAVLAIGFLLGAGALFAWRRSHVGAGETSGVKVLAVLPFENLGDSADAYFADGVSDEVRGKLSQLAGLAVIARASSNEYKRTTKTPQEIARELGAEYLLTATVRWEKHPDGTSRVRVSPELVRVAPDAAPTTKWEEGFDAALTDVFQVQADIAGQVAQALNVALGDSTKRELAAKPTQSLPAYDAFLRGQAAAAFQRVRTLSRVRQAVAAYEQAVALDSTFVEAWAQLAEAQARLYSRTPTPAGAEAVRRTAERALAIAPNRAEGHEALAAYYAFVLVDYARALTEDSTAFALAPGNAGLLGYVGADELTLARWDEARTHLEQAVRLDPRSLQPANRLCLVLLYTRQYSAAEQALDHALQLTPEDLGLRHQRGMVALAQGDLAGAQAVIKAAPKEVDPTELVAYVATSEDLVWVLDHDQQQLLLRLTPSAFDDDRATWGLVRAQTYWLRGDRAKARAYADSARLAVEQQLQAAPQTQSPSSLEDNRHAQLGLALAYLRQKAGAIREGQRGAAIMPISRDAEIGPYFQHQLARIYILVGEPEKALDQLEPLLKIPYYLSPGWLKIDPNFDPLRKNPRFQRLVGGSR